MESLKAKPIIQEPVKEEIKENSNSLDKVLMEQCSASLEKILALRNKLSSNLSSFNLKTKDLIEEKNAISKLKTKIEDNLQFYERIRAISGFIEGCPYKFVESPKFLSDLSFIESGIKFFEINRTFVEAEKYSQLYKITKIKALSKFRGYMKQMLDTQIADKFEGGTPSNCSTFKEILEKMSSSINKQIYTFPSSLGNISGVFSLLSRSAKEDRDVRQVLSQVKINFVMTRIQILDGYIKYLMDKIEENVIYLRQVLNSLNTLVFQEYRYFCEFFKTSLSENRQVLREFLGFYDQLYDKVRPKIIRYSDIRDLIEVFDCVSNSCGRLFSNRFEDDCLSAYLKDILEVEIEHSKFTSEQHKLFYYTCIPKVVKIIQDIQEKMLFHVTLAMENNLADVPLLEEYSIFPFYHYLELNTKKFCFLLLEMSSRIEEKAVNKLTSLFVERFISETNREIRDKKPLIKLDLHFQLELAKKLFLLVKIIEKSGISGVLEDELEFSYSGLLKVFREDKNKDLLSSIEQSLPQIKDVSRDYKKVLQNNLMKCYRGLVSIASRIVFGHERGESSSIDFYKVFEVNLYLKVMEMIENGLELDDNSKEKVVHLVKSGLNSTGKKILAKCFEEGKENKSLEELMREINL